MKSGLNGMPVNDLNKAIEVFIYKLAQRKGVDPDKAVHIYKLLLMSSGDKGLSDEDLEELAGYKQSDVRRVLRLLYDARIATYKKGKHPQTGATRYYWMIDADNINVSLLKRKKLVLEKLKTRLEYEKNNAFFLCPQDNTRFTFDEAFENEFTCPKCGSMLEENENSDYIKVLEEMISRLEEEIRRDERNVFSS